jgi:nucleoid-associated protein YgaU
MLLAGRRSIRVNKRWIIIIILLLLGFGLAAALGAFDSEKPEPAASVSTPTAPAEKSAMEQAKEDAEKAAQSAAAAAKEAAAKAEAEAAKAAADAEAAIKQAAADAEAAAAKLAADAKAAADAAAAEAAKQAAAAKAALDEAAAAAEKAAVKAAEDAKAAAAAVGDAASKAAAGAEKAGGAAVKEVEQGAKAAGEAAKNAYDRAKDAAKRAIQPDNPAPAPQLKNDKDARLESDGDGKGVGQQAMSAAAGASTGQPLQRGPQDARDAPSRRSVQPPADMKTAPASTEDSLPKKPEASFDVVQIERDGSAVFAGKAEPGARVVLRSDDDQIVGAATAGPDGSWVILPENPLPNGESTVRLEATNANGVTTAAPQTLIVSKKPGAAPLVVAQSDAVQTPTVVLQQPKPETNTQLAKADMQAGDAEKAVSERIRTQDGALTVGTVDYDKVGRMTVQGKAPPGADVSVDVDGKAVGSAKADAAGNWRLNTAPGAATGGARIGATANFADGGKLATGSVAGRTPSAPLLRVSLPFAPMGLVKEFPRGRLVVVQPGNSLWRIARRTYGDGVRYTVIYAANAGQIRNPDLIYPGQIFHAPQSASASAQQG